jgi:zinc transport system permease protein
MIIVIGMKIAGALLISALIVFPAICAIRICKSFGGVMIGSAIVGSICAAVGFFISLILETPVGATIAATDIVGYGLVSLLTVKRKP